jgi:hypothetical protein
MTQTAPQRPCFVESEVFTPAVSFLNLLRSGELLSGTPTVTEITSSDLTIDNVARNTGTITIDGVSHEASQAVQFRVASGHVATTGHYRLRIDCDTDATPAQTLSVFIEFDVEDDGE